MAAHLESIEMEVFNARASSVASKQPPRSAPINIVAKRPKTVPLPRGPDRETSFAERWSISTRRSHLRSTSSSEDDSSSASNKSTNAVIRPFSGNDTNRCVEDFVADIDAECSRLGWNGSTVLEKAKSFLTGRAATLLVVGNFVSWEGLRELLLHQYGHRDSLRHCVRLQSENIMDFRRRIMEVADRESMRVLIRGLHPDVAQMVAEAQPTSLMHAACLAAICESVEVDTESDLIQRVRHSSSPLASPSSSYTVGSSSETESSKIFKNSYTSAEII